MVKFILHLSSDDENDVHYKAVVELTPESAGLLIRMRDVFNAASLVSSVVVDQIDFIGPVDMRVVAVGGDGICDDDIRDDPPTVDDACADPNADVNWTENELDFDEARTEINRVCVCDEGVRWTSYLKHCNTKLLSAYLPWETIEHVFSRSELP